MLRKLKHVDKDSLVLTKGRAACELDTADELLTTELMFNGVFSNLDKHELVALCACLIPLGEKSQVRWLFCNSTRPQAQTLCPCSTPAFESSVKEAGDGVRKGWCQEFIVNEDYTVSSVSGKMSQKEAG